jgi:hypothetical protein
MFGTWILNINGGMRKLILVGIGIILWGVWLSRNNVSFDKKPVLPYIKVIYRATHWVWTWSLFQEEVACQQLHDDRRLLEMVSIEIFERHGWRFRNRLCLS